MRFLSKAILFSTLKLSLSIKSDAKSVLISGKDAVVLNKSTNNCKFLDASWYLDKKIRNAKSDFFSKRIPGSRFIDIDEVCDDRSELPHMMPSVEQFIMHMKNLGISSDDNLIIYVNDGCFSAPRVWWMFKAFGHRNVQIIDGGLSAFIEAGGKVDNTTPTQSVPSNTAYKVPEGFPKYIVKWNDVLDSVETGAAQILDARSKARFTCQAPEPRRGLQRGHIPGSLNLPFSDLLKVDDNTSFKSIDEIKRIFENSGVIIGSKVITTCGSGVSAAVLCLGLHLLGMPLESVPLYDGSWAEWGSRNDLPKITVDYKE